MSRRLRDALRHVPPGEVYETLKEMDLLSEVIVRWFEAVPFASTEERVVIPQERVGVGDLLRPAGPPVTLVKVTSDSQARLASPVVTRRGEITIAQPFNHGGSRLPWGLALDR